MEEEEGAIRLRLEFLVSAYNTAQGMIKFSDEKASVIFIFYGITLSVLSYRGDRLLRVLRFGDAALGIKILLWTALVGFFISMVYGLGYALATVVPTFNPKIDVKNHRKLYWCHDVLARSVEEYAAELNALGPRGILAEMTTELYSALTIEEMKFDRVARSLYGAMVSLCCWGAITVATFFL